MSTQTSDDHSYSNKSDNSGNKGNDYSASQRVDNSNTSRNYGKSNAKT